MSAHGTSTTGVHRCLCLCSEPLIANGHALLRDNHDILHRTIADESVDLVYLDPPFNSAQNYNAFFQEKDGTAAAAQIQAFKDTWEWNHESRTAYDELSLRTDKLGGVMRAFMEILGPNDMMAYLAMMAPRLVQLREKLNATGSLYLHCDPATMLKKMER